jgi:hypothetical protein
MSHTCKGGEKVMSSVEGGVTYVVGLAVALMVAAAVIPIALTSIATTALTSVNAGVITVFQVLLPLISVIAILLAFLRRK